MTDDRRKQIEEASSKGVIYDDFLQKNYLNTCLNNFIAGAEWADANPQDKIARRTRLSEFRKEIDQLQSDHKILVDVLRDCLKDAHPNSDWPHKQVREALKAIGERE